MATELTRDEQRDLEAAAREVANARNDSGIAMTVPRLVDVLAAIDARRFAANTDRLKSQLEGAIISRYRTLVVERAEAANPGFVVSGGCTSGWRCSRAAKVAVPILRDGALTLAAMCRQHEKIAMESTPQRAAHLDMERAGLGTSYLGRKEQELGPIVAFAKAVGADLSYFVDKLAERGLEA